MGHKKIIITIAPRDNAPITEMMVDAHKLLKEGLKGWFGIHSEVVEIVNSETISH